MLLIPLICFMPVLVATAYFDLRYMRIPNYLSFIGLFIFAATAPFLPMQEIGWRLLTAAAVFVVGFIGFVMRMFGGGDVKLLSVLVLFVPSLALPLFGLVFSASMLLGIAFVATLRSMPGATSTSWVSLQVRKKYPMGVSIALAGLSFPFILTALQNPLVS